MPTRSVQPQEKKPARYGTRPARLALLGLSCLGLSGCMETLSNLETPEWLKAPGILYEDTGAYNDESSTNAEDISSEDLLDADGEWAIVEKSEGYDPSKAHMQARGKVDPSRRRKMKELSPHFEPNAKSGKDHNQRVLLVDSQEKKTPPDKDKDKGLLSDIKGLFTGSNSSEGTPPIPQRKPVKEVSRKSIIKPPPLPARKQKPSQKRLERSHKTSIDTEVLDAVVSDKKKHEAIDWNMPKAVPTKISPPLKPTKKQMALKENNAPHVKATQETKTVFNIRNGRHPGKTRLVLDISNHAEFKTKIDSIRNVLRIRIYDTDWNTKPQGKFTNNSLLGSYVAKHDESNNSVLLEIRLRRASKILKASILPPSTTKYHRIMIDLKE